jgi:acyl carrier protein
MICSSVNLARCVCPSCVWPDYKSPWRKSAVAGHRKFLDASTCLSFRVLITTQFHGEHGVGSIVALMFPFMFRSQHLVKVVWSPSSMIKEIRAALEQAGAAVPDCTDGHILTMKISDFMMDSLEFLQFLLALQDLFHKEIDDGVILNSMSVAEVLETLDNLA